MSLIKTVVFHNQYKTYFIALCKPNAASITNANISIPQQENCHETDVRMDYLSELE